MFIVKDKFLLLAALAGFFVLSASLLVGVSGDVFATTSSITLSIVEGTADRVIDVPPTAEGKFAASSNTTAKVISTGAAGYVLTTTAAPLSFTDSGSGTTYTIGPLGTDTGINIDTFSNPNNTQYNNMWGYKPSQYYNGSSVVDNTTDQYFFPAPINTSQMLDNNPGATSATGKTYDVAIGTRVDNSTAQGSYTSTFTFAVVANLVPYSVTYNANAGSDTVNNMPAINPQVGSLDSSTDTIVLPNNVPTRTGYTFQGWCTEQVTDGAACTGSQYAAGASYVVDQTTTNSVNITLYAMWTGNTYTINYYSNPYQIDNTPLIVTLNGRTYTKTNGGKALAAYGDNIWIDSTANQYCMPLLVSESSPAVTYTTGGDGYITTQTSSGSFAYSGTTYYRSSTGGWHWSGGTIATAVTTKKYSNMSFASATQQMVLDSKANKITQNFVYGQTTNLRSNSYSRSGYTFMGWSTTPTGDVIYTDGQSVSNLATSGSIDLYAIWSFTMQGVNNTVLNYLMPNNQKTTTLKDTRDNKEYSIININGSYWMAQNLRITGTVPADGSNFTGSDVNISVNDLTTGNSYSEPRTHTGTDDAGNATVWYNYAAASARTIIGDSNTIKATSDICPAGWRLPIKTEFQGILGTDYASLFTTGGYYYNGVVDTRNSVWWSSEANDGVFRYGLHKNTGASSMSLSDMIGRADGRFIRCIHR